ncbi:MAG: AMP-binding protein [Pyrinomonadaceae bacterium]
MQYKSLTRQSLLAYLDDYLLRGSAIVFSHRRGLRFIRWSYKHLLLTIRQTARELQVRGIAEGDRVILCGANTPEWAAAFWAILSVGAVVVPLDQESSAEFAVSVQQQTGAKLAIADREGRGVKGLPLPLLALDVLSDTVKSQSTDPLASPALRDSTLAEIIFTSGTTSAPKGVMLTHGNLLANLLPLEHEIARYLKWERFVHPIRFLNLVPLSHVFGQFMGLFVPQLLGGEVHFHDSLNPADIVERTRKNRISVIVLVPRMLESLRRWLERGEGDQLRKQLATAQNLNALRQWWKFRRIHRMFGRKFWAFLSGGATLEEGTYVFWRRLGFAVLQGYGMTETASIVSVTHPFKASGKSIGKLIPGTEVKLEEGGEIVVRGPSISPGYWTSVPSEKTNDEWFHTGDIGTFDETGNLHFKGRAKDVIVTAAGLNIYPEDIEEVLNRQPEIKSSCVINRHGTHGDEPLAVLILNSSDANVEGIIEHANESLAEYQRIRRWHVWNAPEFPLTSTQKILKREVAARIESEFAKSGSQFHGAACDFILSEAARISGGAAPKINRASLKLTNDLKLDSLGRLELLAALEDRFQVDIDESAFTEATTVGDVERIIRGELADASTPYSYPVWSHRFPMTWLRAILFYTIVLPITYTMSRTTVRGLENVKDLKGPSLFIANHVTLADHALILVALPMRLRHRLAIAMEGERLRGWLHPPTGTSRVSRLRLLLQFLLVTSFFHVFPLPKKSGFRRSFEYAAECVQRNFSLLVFPEGERAPRGQMHMSNFKAGIGLLAAELAIPVVPVKLRGLYELKQRRQYFAPKDLVSVSFGEPLTVDGSLSAAAITDHLQRRLEAL